MKELWLLFSSFFQIGICTFGGGYAMLPMLERTVVEKRGWASSEELLDYFAVGQCTPGVIAVNTATFVGYKRRGVWGGVAATLGVVAPSVLIILAVAAVLEQFMHVPAVLSAFAGVRIAVCALIIGTVCKLVRQSVKNWWQIALCAAAFVLVALLGVSSIAVVLGVIALALAAHLVGRKGARA